MTERSAISKRLRFEVMRRDDHACRYCGAKAPDVRLTIDHVVPVVLGGTDDPTNLVTACQDCNSGKSSTSPGAEIVAQVSEEAQRWALAMREAAEVQRARRERVSPCVQLVEDLWDMPRSANWASTVENYEAAGASIHDFGHAIDVAYEATHVPEASRWAYFCGVMRRMLSERAEIAKALIAEASRPDRYDWIDPEYVPSQAPVSGPCPCWDCRIDRGEIREGGDD